MYDAIIIGMGPAGMSAGIYAKRAGLNVLMIYESAPGGLLNKITIVENYLGFKSISGPDLASSMFEHILNEKVPFKLAKVTNVVEENGIKKVTTTKGEFTSKGLIIATGRKPRKSGLINENKFIGKGISYCATCDGFFYKNKDVAVLGGGNSSLEAAIYLSRLCHQVTIINRSDKLRADQELIQEVNQLENVKIIYNENIQSLESREGYLSKIILNNEELKVEGLFVYIGLVPTLPFISHLNLNLEDGYIKVDSKMKTNLVGIYACGDIIKKDLYQIITASSEGAIAASNIK